MEFHEVLLEGVFTENGMIPALSNCLVNNKRQKSSGKILLIKEFFILIYLPFYILQITLELHIRNRMKLKSKFCFA